MMNPTDAEILIAVLRNVEEQAKATAAALQMVVDLSARVKEATTMEEARDAGAD